MVVDTSAAIAFLRDEPEGARIEELLRSATGLLMSSVNGFECRTVLWHRFGPSMLLEFERLLHAAGIEIVPFDADQALLAFDAYRRYGKGSGHPAQLNLADCAAYALATSRAVPLLFKGNDFAHTDVMRCP